MPVIIGWSAATGGVGWQALVIYAIVVFWTPPHSWALAMRHQDDYRAAGVPMLPVVATERHVTKQILVYTELTVFSTLSLTLATSWLYGAIALLASAWLLVTARQLDRRVRRGESADPMQLFARSNTFLAVVFCALAVDSVLALPLLAQ
jgi:protoheme IX farnesyltransferase